MPQVKKSACVLVLLSPVRKSLSGGLLHSNQKSDIPVTDAHLDGINCKLIKWGLEGKHVELAKIEVAAAR